MGKNFDTYIFPSKKIIIHNDKENKKRRKQNKNCENEKK